MAITAKWIFTAAMDVDADKEASMRSTTGSTPRCLPACRA
jgi:hypothetical protein